MNGQAFNIGRISVNEFFENMTYSVANEESAAYLDQVMSGMDEGIIKESLAGSLFIMKSMVVMYLIMRQEDFIERVMTRTFILASGLIKLIPFGKLGKLTSRIPVAGRYLTRGLDAIAGNQQQRSALADTVMHQATNMAQAQGNATAGAGLTSQVSQHRQEVINRDQLKAQMAEGLQRKVFEQFKLKLDTGFFSDQDKHFVRNMMGGSSFYGPIESIDMKMLGQIAERSFIVSDEGELHGSSELQYALLNTLGYYKGSV